MRLKGWNFCSHATLKSYDPFSIFVIQFYMQNVVIPTPSTLLK